jgi:hypothetical protein
VAKSKKRQSKILVTYGPKDMAKGQGVMIAKATSTLATNATKGELKGTKATNRKRKKINI